MKLECFQSFFLFSKFSEKRIGNRQQRRQFFLSSNRSCINTFSTFEKKVSIEQKEFSKDRDKMGLFAFLFGKGKKCARCRKVLTKSEKITALEDKR